MQSQIQSRQAFIGILMVLIASVAFSSKAIMVKLAYVYPVNASTLIALRMLFSIPFFMHPRGDMDLSCMDLCIDEQHPKSFDDIMAGDFLIQRLIEIGHLKK